MKLILTQDVPNLGTSGEIVEVKAGYGRNFLLPRGLAFIATPGAEKHVLSLRKAQDARSIRDAEHANEVKNIIEGLTGVSVSGKTHDEGKLFGSITAGDIADAVKKAGGPTLDRKALTLPVEHIREIGDYKVSVDLGHGVDAAFSVAVVSE